MSDHISCSEELKSVLRTDKATREKTPEGVELREKDVFGVEDLSECEWDYSHPTAEPYVCAADRRNLQLYQTDQAIWGKLVKTDPFLEKVDLSGVLIAGGAVSSIFYEENMCFSKDIDLFLCGYKTIAELETRTQKLGKEIGDYFAASDIPMIIMRSKNAITIHGRYPYMKDIQIILRSYETPSQVLHGFDIGSSAMGFWNGKFMTTSLGRFSLKYGMNIFDNTRRSTSYEYRLFNKYYYRGYGVIMPELDASKIIRDTRINKHVFLNKVFDHPNQFECSVYSSYNSDYGCLPHVVSMIKYHNLDQFAKLDERKNLWYGKECSNGDEVAETILNIECPCPSKEDIITFFEQKLLGKHGIFYVSRIKRYHGSERLLEVFQAFTNKMERFILNW